MSNKDDKFIKEFKAKWKKKLGEAKGVGKAYGNEYNLTPYAKQYEAYIKEKEMLGITPKTCPYNQEWAIKKSSALLPEHLIEKHKEKLKKDPFYLVQEDDILCGIANAMPLQGRLIELPDLDDDYI